MSSQPETLRLADALEQIPSLVKLTNEQAAKELRRLHEVNQELINALGEIEWTDNFQWAKDRARSAIALAKARGEE